MTSKFLNEEERRKKNFRVLLLNSVKKEKVFKEPKKFANFVTGVFSSSSGSENTSGNRHSGLIRTRQNLTKKVH